LAVLTWTRADLSDRQILELIDLAAALAIPEVKRAFTASLRVTLTPEVQADFNAAVRLGNPEAALAVIPWDRFSAVIQEVYGPDGPLVKMFGAGSDLAARLVLPLIPVAEAGGLPLAFADYAPRALDYLQDRGLKLVTLVTEETREAMRSILETAFSDPMNTDTAARAIRDVLQEAVQDGGLIGITTRQAETLNRYIESLVDDPELSAEQIQQLVDRRHRKMVTQRSTMIARTEAYNAGNQGMVDAWKALDASGRVRIAGLDAEFVSDLGERAFAPEIHPSGYCTQRLVFWRFEEGTRVYAREWVTRVVGVCHRCHAFDGKRALPAA
jgi:hypothetical protein